MNSIVIISNIGNSKISMLIVKNIKHCETFEFIIKSPFCHSVLDTESSVFKRFWIPAFPGMPGFPAGVPCRNDTRGAFFKGLTVIKRKYLKDRSASEQCRGCKVASQGS